MAIFKLLYRSQSRSEASRNQVQQIVETSTRNNARADITGLLLYNGKIFLQLLEGEEKAVRRCYEKISQDSRHIFPVILAHVTSEKRLFPAWKMGSVEMKPETIPGDLSAYLKIAAGHGSCDDDLVLKILREFAVAELPKPSAAVG